MPALTHKSKYHIAVHMRTHDELIAQKPLFETAGWQRRSATIRERVKRQQSIAHYYAVLRKDRRKEENRSGTDNRRG